METSSTRIDSSRLLLDCGTMTLLFLEFGQEDSGSVKRHTGMRTTLVQNDAKCILQLLIQ